MTTYDFVTRLADSLAWPVVVLVVVWVMRNPLGRLLTQGNLKRVKAPGVEVEWQQVEAKAKEAVTGTLTTAEVAHSKGDNDPGPPNDVVQRSYDLLREELVVLLRELGGYEVSASLSASTLAQAAGTIGLISEDAVNTIGGIDTLHELLVYRGKEVSSGDVAMFVTLVGKSLNLLQEQKARRRAIMRKIRSLSDSDKSKS